MKDIKGGIQELRRRLKYEPKTGLFISLTDVGGRGKGSVAGCKNVNGYIQISFSGYTFYAHRLAWYYMKGLWPDAQIDHVNGVRDDNRWINLRSVTNQENSRNTANKKDYGCVGVCWDKARGKWASAISIDYKTVHLGRYGDYFEACCARKSAERRYGYHENHGRASI